MICDELYTTSTARLDVAALLEFVHDANMPFILRQWPHLS